MSNNGDKFEILFKEAENPIFIINSAAMVTNLNKAFAEFLQLELENVKGKNISAFFPPNRINQQKRFFTFSKKKKIKLDFFTHKRLKSLFLNIVPIESGGQKLLFGIGIEIKDLDNILKNFESKFKKTELYKDLFTHDMGNILQSIKSSVDFILENYSDINKGKNLDTVSKIAEDQIIRGSKLVSNIKNLSKLQEKPLNTINLNLEDVIKKLIIEIKKKYTYKKIKLTFNSKSSKAIVEANELLKEIFENIILNGIVYNTENVLVLINIYKIQVDRQKFWSVEFIDNGIGIHPDTLDLIQDSVLKSDSRSYGIGLGLFFSHKALKLFNGTMKIEHNNPKDYREGTKVIIRLPAIN